MTEAIREKTSARRVLAVLIGLLATILALQGLASVKPGGFEAFAATTPSPTPTGPSIQFINPAKPAETSNELSDKDDGSATDKTTYHLVAWAHLAPAGSGVQFKYDPGTATDNQPEITIGNGTLVGTDTWEFHWDIPDTLGEAGGQDPTSPAPRPSPTTGVLKAILFNSSGAEVARDEESISINNKDRTSDQSTNFLIEDQAETVEISYPTNGGQLGFYGSQDGTYTGIVEVTYSAGVSKIDAMYTVDPPGTEPNFVLCGSEAPGTTTGFDPGTAEDGIRCTLAAGDLPRHVTAVAAVAWDRSQEPAAAADEKDSSDAHRAFAYEQDPTSVVITPSTDTEDVNKCNDPSFTAVVTDASGQQVAGANVDVHAQGPSDNLHFDDSDGARSSANKPPDQGNHPSEPGVDCEASTQPTFIAGVQGDHEQLNAADVKHIESTIAASTSAATRAQGTDDSGSFRFTLLSRDPGGTQITAWADEDFNDRFCTDEAAGNASIGWASAAPSPTGVTAEEGVCPRPTPGVTGSPTATGTVTPTATSTTARPTGTATSTGPTTDRTVTMSVDQARVVAGQPVVFSGQILSGDRSCTDNEFVQIRRRVLGTTSYRDLLTTATDSQGRFTYTRRVVKSADYVAVATAHDNCRESSSGEVTVLVQVKLQIISSDNTPNRGDRVRIKSSVRPQHDGTKLVLQRKKGSRWVKVAVKSLNRRSQATFTIRANFGSRTFRTLWRSQDAEHESNTSRERTIRTH